MKYFNQAILFCIIFLTLLSCGKDSNTITPSNPTISTDTVRATPYQIVAVNVEGFTLNSDTYLGTLGSTNITLYKADSKTLVFIVPEITPETASLNITLGTFSSATSLIIDSLIFTSNPLTYVNNYYTEVQSTYGQYESLINNIPDSLSTSILDKNKLRNDFHMLQAQILISRNDFQTLSLDAKTYLAKLIYSNPKYFSTDGFLKELGTDQSPEELGVDRKDKLKRQGIRIIVATTLATMSCSPGIAPPICAIFVVITGMELHKGIVILWSSVGDKIVRGSSISMNPISLDNNSPLNLKTIYNFAPNQPTTVVFKANYRNISSSDVNSQSELYSSIANSFINIKTSWDRFVSIITAILPSVHFTQGAPDINSIPVAFRNDQYVKPQYLTISNVSNSSISVSSSIQGQNMIVTFTSTLTAPTDFSMNVNYSFPGVSNFSNTINARLIPSDQSYIGRWLGENLNDPSYIFYYTMQNNGTVICEGPTCAERLIARTWVGSGDNLNIYLSYLDSASNIITSNFNGTRNGNIVTGVRTYSNGSTINLKLTKVAIDFIDNKKFIKRNNSLEN